MPEYKCNICDKQSSKKSNMVRHVEQVHRFNQNAKLIAIRIGVDCTICNVTFTSKSSYTKHMQKCKQDNEVMKLKMENEILRERFKMQEECNKKLAEKDSKLAEKDKIINSLAKTSGKSIKNVLAFVTQNYKNAPALTQIEDCSYLLKHNENYSLGKIISHYHQNNKLIDHLVDLIEHHYKKKNPAEQSLWSSDVSRLSYVINTKVHNEIVNWVSDKKGNITAEIVIAPVIDMCINEVKLYLKELKKLEKRLYNSRHNIHGSDSSDSDEENNSNHKDKTINENYLFSEHHSASTALQDLTNGEIKREVLKKITPKLQFSKTNFQITAD
jgi:F0F1-type ATP synthase delta subunit